ncbi:WD40-repeat-containing domain protein [Lipomyces japonicus]|uniref:WD40-repeat-containing domain protein n=1 Tax=Lipomyces japonicus TaxID=56871 RepID=UPI0034CE76B1
MADYKLSRSLKSHSSDVRGVVFPKEDLIVSVSRDRTLRVWKPLPGSAESKLGIEWSSDISYESTKYLNSIAWLGDKDLIASSGLDPTITVASLSSQSSINYVLKGHEGNVCALHYNDDVLISGSWDKNAIVWQEKSIKYILRGHEQAVWAVLALSKNSFLTGSADKTIRLWQGDSQVSIFKGHTDVVRSLALIGDNKFASASNDGSIRIWNFHGENILELYGHSSFIYSVAYLPSTDEIISSGEDRTVRVWKNGECTQTIYHPCNSVWTVAVNSKTGDIVTGSSDSVVRVFSRSKSRWASQDELAKFEEEVASYAISTSEVGNISKDKLQGPEALSNPGTKIGQVLMIKTPLSSVDAYQWSGDQWVKVGEVVSAVGNQQKQLYKGKEYDYVFDVDVKEGAPPLKLPFNATENPYDAARRFLEANELPLEYLDETAKFIEKNASGIELGPQSAPVANDPYGSRYVPSNSTASTYPVATRKKQSIFSQKSYLSFKSINVAAINKKVREINETKNLQTALSASELSDIASLLPLADSGWIEDAAHKLTIISLKIVDLWLPQERLSALDILRVTVPLLSDANLVNSTTVSLLSSSINNSYQNNTAMVLRLLVNLFESDIGQAVISQLDVREKILDISREFALPTLSKIASIALSTLLLNYSVLTIKDKDLELAFSIIGVITEFLAVVNDPEAAYRLLIAFGTVISVDSPEVVEAGKSLDGSKAVKVVQSKFINEKRIKEVSENILYVLK